MYNTSEFAFPKWPAYPTRITERDRGVDPIDILEPSDYDTYVDVVAILSSFVETLDTINRVRLCNSSAQEQSLQKVEQVINKYINKIHKDVFNDN